MPAQGFKYCDNKLVYLDAMTEVSVSLRWNRKRLWSNDQGEEYLCPHEEIARPWTIYPSIVNQRGKTVWSPGPSIRDCCVDRGKGLAIAAWWWEVDNRFQDLEVIGLPDQELARSLLEQRFEIRAVLSEPVPIPSDEDRQQYLFYREDLGLVRLVRILKTPKPFKQLNLPVPCTPGDLNKR